MFFRLTDTVKFEEEYYVVGSFDVLAYSFEHIIVLLVSGSFFLLIVITLIITSIIIYRY